MPLSTKEDFKKVQVVVDEKDCFCLSLSDMKTKMVEHVLIKTKRSPE
jgi:hypothetical protein